MRRRPQVRNATGADREMRIVVAVAVVAVAAGDLAAVVADNNAKGRADAWPLFYALPATGRISRTVVSVGLGMAGDCVVASAAESELARYPVCRLRLASASCCG